MNEHMCPVCGYEMADGPRDFNICPSCGTEFGLHDVNSTIENLRTAWFATGPRWYSNVVSEPANWNPFLQVTNAMRSGISGSSITVRDWSAQSFVASVGIQREEVTA
jgi:hypothetical protein